MPSDAIDTALVNYLNGDATLSGLLTGGVHDSFELINPTAPTMPYAIVLMLNSKDVREFRRRAWEECRFLITLTFDPTITSKSTVRQACARIDQLLDGGSFAISGYTLLKSEREQRFAGMIQVDEFTEPLNYFGSSYGGLYVIWAQAN